MWCVKHAAKGEGKRGMRQKVEAILLDRTMGVGHDPSKIREEGHGLVRVANHGLEAHQRHV